MKQKIILKKIDGSSLNVLIVQSVFNKDLSSELYQNCLLGLKKLNVKYVKTIDVMGALELPITAKLAIQKNKPDVVIALGIVIKGDTSHFEHVSHESHSGLMTVALMTNTPVIFGIITAYNLKQVTERISAKKMNNGQQYAQTAVEMGLLKKSLK